MPERLCSAYFRTTEDLKFQDVLSAITNSIVTAEEVRCIQYKKVSQFAKEVHVTFSSPTFCSRFVNSTSLAVNEKSYFILSAHRPVTFVGVFYAPFELADEAIIKRLEDFYGCQVVNTYRNCHQGTKIPSGSARFLSSLMATFLPPYDLGVFRFVCFIEIRNRCAINVIAMGILRVNAPMLFVLTVII